MVGQLRSGKNYIVVSADTHASPATFEDYLAYVDPAHRAAIEAEGALDLSMSVPGMGAIDQVPVDEDDPIREAVMRKTASMSIDPVAAREWYELYREDQIHPDDADGKRLLVLEELGIHAEITYPNPHLRGTLPRVLGNFTTLKGQGPHELYGPAIQGFNRWLSDYCNAAPGRRAGVLQVSLHDLDAAIREIEWARGAGIFGGVMLPPMSDELPGYSDEYYDPFWSACEDNGMVVNIHTGGDAAAMAKMYDPKYGRNITLYEVFLFSRRPLWFMLLGGVFDRHPKLKVAIAENGLQWYPALIRDLELVVNGHGGAPIRASLKMTPREYFHEHIWLGGSLMQRHEAEERDRIGVDRMMWGTDYPHLEGAAPIHRQVMNYVLGGLPEEDIRRILGTTAIDLYGFDEAQLQEVADRCGPTVADLDTVIGVDQVDKAFSWSIPRQAPVVATVAS